MQLYPRWMEMPEIEAKFGTLDTRANVALALAIIVVMAQLIMAVFVFKIWLNARPSHRSDDAERGLELENTGRGVPADGRPRGLQSSSTMASPVGPSSAESRGRPVAAYNRDARHGERDDYYNPRPISKKPTWTAGSGLGEQTHGTDYTTQRREISFESDPKTNRNNTDYGRKGNRFAHGT